MKSHYYIKAFNEKFVQVDSRDRLVASAANEQQGSKFQFEEVKEAKFALKQPDGRYVRVLPGQGGGLVADAATLTPASIFYLLHFGGAEVALAYREMDHRDVVLRDQCAEGCRCRFVGLNGYKEGELNGHLPGCVTWEVFTLVPAEPWARPLQLCLREEFDALAEQVSQFDSRFKTALENLRDSTPSALADLCKQQLAAIDARLEQLAERERQASELVASAQRHAEQAQTAHDAIAAFLKHGNATAGAPPSRQPKR